MWQDYNTSMKPTMCRWGLWLGLACCGQAWAGVPTLDLELATRYDDNLSRGEAQRDQLSDVAVDLGLSAGYTRMLTANSGIRLNAHVRHSAQQRYDALDLLNLGIDARYRIQPVAGYTAPWIELGAGYEHLSYRDSAVRDGERRHATLMLGKRFTDRLGGRIGLGREWRDADQEDVFEWQRTRQFALLEYKTGLTSTLYLQFQHEDGDQVFTATPGPDYRRYAKAVADDPAFGARRAYRLGADARSLDLGWNLPLTYGVLDLGLRYFEADASGGHTYEDSELRLGWTYRFQ